MTAAGTLRASSIIATSSRIGDDLLAEATPGVAHQRPGSGSRQAQHPGATERTSWTDWVADQTISSPEAASHSTTIPRGSIGAATYACCRTVHWVVWDGLDGDLGYGLRGAAVDLAHQVVGDVVEHELLGRRSAVA